MYGRRTVGIELFFIGSTDVVGGPTSGGTVGSANNAQHIEQTDHVALFGVVERAQFALRLLNGKWVVPILDTLSRQPRRHGELLRALGPKLSEKVLTETLRRMEAAQLIRRSAINTIPPSVLYALTDTGRSLLDPVHRMSDWTAEHWHEIAVGDSISERS